ncbi:hypothetical protein [Blastopirellula marina]|uniref:Uncharacterized protein n=1 Tax=Blastopirellula marina TaxID=124 RepID=A0A2S8FPA7_9BACT|nr:hypothetical protein [Blastopirellula marina]PQO34012.1 hypothetical protein C5Y98_17525 [Blastopirellula marina]PTL43798.1 hypothetical protein C5Y97_17535 [Blastopirellula marina]
MNEDSENPFQSPTSRASQSKAGKTSGEWWENASAVFALIVLAMGVTTVLGMFVIRIFAAFNLKASGGVVKYALAIPGILMGIVLLVGVIAWIFRRDSRSTSRFGKHRE